MATKPKTYTVRNKMTGEIVGYWDNIPASDDGIKARLRQEFGQGRFQITYTGRKKLVDDNGKERWVTHPVNQFFIVGNASLTGRSHYADSHSMGGNFSAGGEYREFILPFITETRQAISAMANDIAAMTDTLAIVRGNLDSLLTEDEDGVFDDVEEKGGFGLESLVTNPKYQWAIPLFMSGDKEALANGIAERLKTEPTLLHDFITDLMGGAIGGE